MENLAEELKAQEYYEESELEQEFEKLKEKMANSEEEEFMENCILINEEINSFINNLFENKQVYDFKFDFEKRKYEIECLINILSFENNGIISIPPKLGKSFIISLFFVFLRQQKYNFNSLVVFENDDQIDKFIKNNFFLANFARIEIQQKANNNLINESEISIDEIKNAQINLTTIDFLKSMEFDQTVSFFENFDILVIKDCPDDFLDVFDSLSEDEQILKFQTNVNANENLEDLVYFYSINEAITDKYFSNFEIEIKLTQNKFEDNEDNKNCFFLPEVLDLKNFEEYFFSKISSPANENQITPIEIEIQEQKIQNFQEIIKIINFISEFDFSFPLPKIEEKVSVEDKSLKSDKEFKAEIFDTFKENEIETENQQQQKELQKQQLFEKDLQILQLWKENNQNNYSKQQNNKLEKKLDKYINYYEKSTNILQYKYFQNRQLFSDFCKEAKIKLQIKVKKEKEFQTYYEKIHNLENFIKKNGRLPLSNSSNSEEKEINQFISNLKSNLKLNRNNMKTPEIKEHFINFLVEYQHFFQEKIPRELQYIFFSQNKQENKQEKSFLFDLGISEIAQEKHEDFSLIDEISENNENADKNCDKRQEVLKILLILDEKTFVNINEKNEIIHHFDKYLQENKVKQTENILNELLIIQEKVSLNQICKEEVEKRINYILKI